MSGPLRKTTEKTFEPSNRWVQSQNRPFIVAQELSQLLQQLGLCDQRGKRLFDQAMPPFIDPTIRASVDEFLSGPVWEGNPSVTRMQMVEELSKRLANEKELAGKNFTFYHRGSHARSLINQMAQLDSLIESKCCELPQEQAKLVRAQWKKIQNNYPLPPPPNDMDWLADSEVPCTFDDLPIIENCVGKWVMERLPGAPFEFIKPRINILTQTNDQLIILKIGDKFDLVLGTLVESKRLFTIDSQAIRFQGRNYCFVGQDKDFWQSTLDASQKIVRISSQHRKDFRAILAAIQLQTNKYTVVEEDESIEAVCYTYFSIATPWLLFSAMKQRLENHKVDSFSFLVNVLLNAKSEPIKQGAVWQLIRAELKEWHGLDLSQLQFEEFVTELYYFMECAPHHRLFEEHKICFPRSFVPSLLKERNSAIQRFFECQLLLFPCEQHPELSQQNPYAELYLALQRADKREGFSDLIQEALLDYFDEEGFKEQGALAVFLKDRLGLDLPVTKEKYLQALLKSPFATKNTVALWKRRQKNKDQEAIFRTLYPLLSAHPLLVSSEFAALEAPSFALLKDLAHAEVGVKRKVIEGHLEMVFSQMNPKTRQRNASKLPASYQEFILFNPSLFSPDEAAQPLLNLLKRTDSHSLLWKIEGRGIEVPHEVAMKYKTSAPQNAAVSQEELKSRLLVLLHRNEFHEFSLLLPLLETLFPQDILEKAVRKCPGELAYGLVLQLEGRGVRLSTELHKGALLKLPDESLMHHLQACQRKVNEKKFFEELALICIQTRRLPESYRLELMETLLNSASSFDEKVRLHKLFREYSQEEACKASIKIEEFRRVPKYKVNDYLAWLIENRLATHVVDILQDRAQTMKAEELQSYIEAILEICDKTSLQKLARVAPIEARAGVVLRIKKCLGVEGPQERLRFVDGLSPEIQQELLLDAELFETNLVASRLTGLLQKNKSYPFAWALEERGIFTDPHLAPSLTIPEGYPQDLIKERLKLLLEKHSILEALQFAEQIRWPHLQRFYQVCLARAMQQNNLQGVLQVVNRSNLVPEIKWLSEVCSHCNDPIQAGLLLDLLKKPQVLEKLKKETPGLMARIFDSFAGGPRFEEAVLFALELANEESFALLLPKLLNALLQNNVSEPVRAKLLLLNEPCRVRTDWMLGCYKLAKREQMPVPDSLSEDFFHEAMRSEGIEFVLREIKNAPQQVPLFSLELLRKVREASNPKLFAMWKELAPPFNQEYLEILRNSPDELLILADMYGVESVEVRMALYNALSESKNLTVEQGSRMIAKLKLSALPDIEFLRKLCLRFEKLTLPLVKRLMDCDLDGHPQFVEVFSDLVERLVRKGVYDWLMMKPGVVKHLTLDKETLRMVLDELFNRLHSIKNNEERLKAVIAFFTYYPISAYSEKVLLKSLLLRLPNELRNQILIEFAMKFRRASLMDSVKFSHLKEAVLGLVADVAELENMCELNEVGVRVLCSLFLKNPSVLPAEKWAVHKAFLDLKVIFDFNDLIDVFNQFTKIDSSYFEKVLIVHTIAFEGSLKDLDNERSMVFQSKALQEKKYFKQEELPLYCAYLNLLKSLQQENTAEVDKNTSEIVNLKWTSYDNLSKSLENFVKEFPEQSLFYFLTKGEWALFEEHLYSYLYHTIPLNSLLTGAGAASLEAFLYVVSKMPHQERLNALKNGFVVLSQVVSKMVSKADQRAIQYLVPHYLDSAHKIIKQLGGVDSQMVVALTEQIEKFYFSPHCLAGMLDHEVISFLDTKFWVDKTYKSKNEQIAGNRYVKDLKIVNLFNRFYVNGSFGKFESDEQERGVRLKLQNLFQCLVDNPSEYHENELVHLLEEILNIKSLAQNEFLKHFETVNNSYKSIGKKLNSHPNFKRLLKNAEAKYGAAILKKLK